MSEVETNARCYHQFWITAFFADRIRLRYFWWSIKALRQGNGSDQECGDVGSEHDEKGDVAQQAREQVGTLSVLRL